MNVAGGFVKAVYVQQGQYVKKGQLLLKLDDALLRTPAELTEIVRYEPFAAADRQAEGHGLYVAFVKVDPAPAAKARLQGFTTEIDAFQVRGREIYWLCRKKSSESTFSGGILEKTLGQAATLRNITTVKKLAAQYG